MTTPSLGLKSLGRANDEKYPNCQQRKLELIMCSPFKNTCSRLGRLAQARLAQSVGHLTPVLGVVGSRPLLGVNFLKIK